MLVRLLHIENGGTLSTVVRLGRVEFTADCAGDWFELILALLDCGKIVLSENRVVGILINEVRIY